MPKKPNYSFEKRKKELDRKAKKEEKARRKREGIPDDGIPDDGTTDDGTSGEPSDDVAAAPDEATGANPS